MNKHTPGPWNDGPTINLCGCHHVGLNIGFLGTSSSKRYEEGLANARLITAAPELLEALIQARRALAWASEQRPEFEAEYDLADHAIAKATGQ